MTKKAPISMCLIVKNEPLLEQCILSFRDYVEELVIIDTGSTDTTTIEVAKKYADIFESYNGCNDPETGLIDDFSNARNYSLSKATQPWVMWCDGDDVIVGVENLLNIVSTIPQDTDHNSATAIMFPYEYAYNELGQCICLHYRERLFSNKNKFHFTNPVHEVAIPNDGINVNFLIKEESIYKHKRQFGSKIQENGRNLRILRKYFAKEGSKDARTMYYLGLETYNAGLPDEAIDLFTKYIDISGWDDERVMACLKLIDIYAARGQYEEGLKWGFKAISLKENWGEGYFAISKMFYFLAQRGGPTEHRNWERCAHFAKLGLSLPPTKTLLFVNPLDREYEIHIYLNIALNKIGDAEGALSSVNTGLRSKPNDPTLNANKKFYDDFFARQQINTALNKLKESNNIDQNIYDSVIALVDKHKPEIKTQLLIPGSELSKSGFPIAGNSDNPNGWAIPNTIDFNGFPLQMTNDQLQSVVIMIWKQYMLHDEVLSAISFLENAPYNVRHTLITEKALNATKACLVWMDDKDDFQKINAPANPEVEAGNPLPNKLVMSEGHRFDFVVDRLKPNSTLVDFGSMDGCFTNRFGMLGHKPTGLDVCESSIKLARKKAIEFNTGAEYVCTYFQDAIDKVPNNHFEYATSTDTYEHIKDPVRDMFLPAKKMLKADGKFLLATPHGAWMRGQYLEWAHPWLWAREGKSWLQESPRAHLIAPTVWTLSAQFREAGYWVKDCYPDLCDNTYDLLSQEVVDQGNLFTEAHLKFPEEYDKGKDIVFFIGNGVETWTPKSVEKTGIGGSELMAIEMSKRLAAAGHKVRVYAGCGPSGEGIYDGVEYRTTDKFQDLKCDVLVVSRRADYLGDQYNIQAKLKLLWVHDVYAAAATNELLLKADRIIALSEWHKNNLINAHNLHSNHIIVSKNGIDLSLFENKNIKRNKLKCINASSPDRSWPILLNLWPRIKEQVPQAELHLYYGFKNWKYSAQFDQLQMDLINRLEAQIKHMAPLGVVYHDRINQEELANEFLSAGALLHPTWFTETFGITFANAQAAGVRIVSSSIAALNEIVAKRGTLIDGVWTDAEYQNKFVAAAVQALLSDDNSDRENLKQYAKDHFGLNELAKDWEKMFSNLIEEKKTNPITPYQPTAKYR